jgi:hypothetical protein
VSTADMDKFSLDMPDDADLKVIDNILRGGNSHYEISPAEQAAFLLW